MCYIRTGITFWLGVQQKGIYTGYLIIGKETLSPKSPKFPFSLHFFPFTVLSERFHLFGTGNMQGGALHVCLRAKRGPLLPFVSVR